jgi:hypothetical protein
VTAGGRTIARPGVLDSAAEYVIVTVLAAVVAATAGTWVTGQLAGLLFRGAWPPVSIGQALSIATHLATHLTDPRMAWPAGARRALPGPAGFATAAAITASAMTAATVLTGRRVLAGRGHRGYASRAQIAASLSEKAVLARASTIRPSLAGTPAAVTDVGVRAGRATPAGTRLAISVLVTTDIRAC